MLSGMHLTEELKEPSQQPRDPLSGQYRALVGGAGGETWVLGKRITAHTYDVGDKGGVILNERTYALGLLQEHIRVQGQV